MVMIENYLEKIGLISDRVLWYCIPNLSLDVGIRPLTCDADMIKLLEAVKGYDVMHAYVEHIIDTPTLVDVDVEVGDANVNLSDDEVVEVCVNGDQAETIEANKPENGNENGDQAETVEASDPETEDPHETNAATNEHGPTENQEANAYWSNYSEDESESDPSYIADKDEDSELDCELVESDYEEEFDWGVYCHSKQLQGQKLLKMLMKISRIQLNTLLFQRTG